MLLSPVKHLSNRPHPTVWSPQTSTIEDRICVIPSQVSFPQTSSTEGQTVSVVYRQWGMNKETIHHIITKSSDWGGGEMGGTENRLHPPGGWGWGWGTGQWGEVGEGGGQKTACTHLWRPLIREAELLRASDVCRASTLPLLVKPRIDWSSSPNVKPHRCILRL